VRKRDGSTRFLTKLETIFNLIRYNFREEIPVEQETHMDPNFQQQRTRSRVTLAALAALFLLLVLLNLALGSVAVPLGEVARALGSPSGGGLYADILWKLRLPRTAAGAVLGGALALSGLLLQTFFNNPIAGPYVLGVSSGAKLAVALVLVLVLGRGHALGSAPLVGAAFAGALAAMGVVLLIARRGQGSPLIVCGVMVGYVASALCDFLITFADDANIVNLHNWSRGSFSGAAWPEVGVMAAVALPASALALLLAKPMGAYQLGEAHARGVGVNIRLFRVALVLISSVLCACVTAFAGPVSFVGVAVPHLVKACLKTAKPLAVIPACLLGGAVFCLGCDFIARTLFAPAELGVSSVTAALGAPVVIGILLKKRGRGG
jgi:iron complex transport system permease protein